jgi:hypothetical protein
MVAAAAERLAAPRSDAALAAFGAVVAIVVILAMTLVIQPGPSRLMPTRAAGITAAQRTLDQGGPPLTGRVHGKNFPVGISDDQGIYLYASEFGHAFGVSKPGASIKWIWAILFALTITMAPLIYARLFGSVVAALLGTAALAVLVISFGTSDIYWINAWAIVALLPLVFVLNRRWPRRRAAGLAVVAAIAVAASFATSIRSAAGLPVVIALALVVGLRPARWRIRLGLLAVLLAGYLAITPLGLDAVRSYRNHQLHAQIDKGLPASHGVWHNTYIGLGFLPNQWNLQYLDVDGIRSVGEAKPGAKLGTAGYNAEARRLFIRAIGDDPSYVARETAQKVVATTGHAVPYLFVLAFFTAFAVVLGVIRKVRPMALLTLPAMLFGLVPAILVMPLRPYELGIFAAVGILAVMLTGLVAEPAFAALRSHQLLSLLRSRLPVLAVSAAVIVLAAAWVATRNIDSRSANWQAQKVGRPILP